MDFVFIHKKCAVTKVNRIISDVTNELLKIQFVRHQNKTKVTKYFYNFMINQRPKKIVSLPFYYMILTAFIKTT